MDSSFSFELFESRNSLETCWIVTILLNLYKFHCTNVLTKIVIVVTLNLYERWNNQIIK